MRAVLRDIFVVPFTESFEGGVACAYADIRGKVTIAYGNLVDTPGDVAALPLVRADGSSASIQEKIALWNVLHDDPNAAKGGWHYAAKLSPLRLTRDAMTGLALARMEANDRILSNRCIGWEEHPAMAQLAMHSLAWACGAGAQFPKLFSALAAKDYDACSVEIHMNEWTPEGLHNTGLIPRNVANKVLMRNAAHVVGMGLDPDLIEWLKDLAIPAEPSTQPDLGEAHADPVYFDSEKWNEPGDGD